MKKYIIAATVLCLFLGQSCKKNERTGVDGSTTGLSIENARIWYEQNAPGTISPISLREKARIKPFAPLWNKAKNGEDKEYHVVETPLRFETAPGFSMNSGQRIGGRTSLLILKNKSNRRFRSVLMHTITHAGNENEASYLQRGRNFSGNIFFTDLDGRFINGWIYKDGKVVAASRFSSGGNEGSRAALPENCETKEIRWYERTCIFYNDYSIECSSWQYVGSTYQTYCTEEGSGGVEGSNECDIPDGREFLAQSGPVSEADASSSGPQKTGANGEITKEWSTSWRFYKGTFLTYTWRYISFEKGVHKKVNNVWKWKSITHVSHGQDGPSPFNTTCTMLTATPSISPDERTAKMDLTYEVKMCITCKGWNLGCFPEIAYSGKFWTIQPNGVVSA